MYRTKSVVLDNIKPYFVARVLHPKKAKKKKKIVKFSISFRSVAISCFPIGQDFNVLFHNIYRVFFRRLVRERKLFFFQLIWFDWKQPKLFSYILRQKFDRAEGKKSFSRHKLYTRKHAILNNKIFAHLACNACILLWTISSGLYF